MLAPGSPGLAVPCASVKLPEKLHRFQMNKKAAFRAAFLYYGAGGGGGASGPGASSGDGGRG